MNMHFFARLVSLLVLSVASTVAQNVTNPPLPKPVPLPAPIAAPADKPYPGALQLEVDITNTTDHVMHVRERVPAERGAKEMVLLYPEWIPGNHSPTGPISHLAGIVTSVDGKRVQWVRDQINVYAFHIPLGASAQNVEVEFDYLSPHRQAEGRVEMSDAIVDLQWNEVLLYPAGYFSRQTPFNAIVKLPANWKYATALETASEQNSVVSFRGTTLNTLVDSPLYAGSHFKRIDLSPSATDIVHLDLFADEEKDLAITPEQLQKHKQLAVEADKLYASHHYNHYDLLLLLSEKVGEIGLEHHQSSENGLPANFFLDWNNGVLDRDLLSHEYTHSWNGKFRRPADLWTPNFDVPMRDDLLWVYEGMTQYWGIVLAARSGLRSPEETRDMLAHVAAGFEIMPGRQWRPLVDTTNQPTISQRRPVSFVSWQLPENYYEEAALIWVDADTKIRELSNGQKSLDDFAKAFFGVYNGSFVTLTYNFDDVVKTLNSVAPYDWGTFLRERVYQLHPSVPEDGFTRGGYKLVYTDNEQEWMTRNNAAEGLADFSTSLGISIVVSKPNAAASDDDGPPGSLARVWWNSPAFKAGVTPDMQLVSVNGKEFTPDLLRDAILQAEQTKQPIQLQFKRGNEYVAFPLAYFEGLRIPSLQRVDGTPDRLNEILAPSKSPLPAM
jgi:predicted metalloprotease with PDZ domain